MSTSDGGMSLTEPVSIARDHIRGPQHAPVTLLEYGDYECPYCGAAHPVVEAVREAMGPSLTFAFRNFPLTAVHPHAFAAAESAEAAGAQGQFWEMHDLLLEDQRHLEMPDLIARATALDLDVEEFTAAIVSGAFANRVQADFLGGVRSGVRGTPTFFVNGVRYSGTPDYVNLLRAVQVVVAHSAR
jgi:protein-disulfide isomerase